MDAERGFHIILPSNVQPDYHTNNTASAFQTTFPSSYQLTGNWEVALSEISYVNTIPTITNQTFSVNSDKLETDLEKFTFTLSNFFYDWSTSEESSLGLGSNTKSGNKFVAKDSACPFSVKWNTKTDRIDIKAETEDLEPNVYLAKWAADKLQVGNPFGRTIKDDKGDEYKQLWTSTLERGKTYHGWSTPKSLKPAVEVTFTIKQTECLRIEIPKGFYPTVEALVEALNQETKHALADWNASEKSEGKKSCGYKFDYNKGENRIVLGLYEHTDLTFHNDLHVLLGFAQPYQHWKRQQAEFAPFLDHGIYNLFIYCDLCAPIRVGDVLVPLLRTINLPAANEWGKVVCTRFNRPMYIPIAKSSFNSIRIELYDDAGTPIKFTEGRTVLTLHIRPCKSL